MKQWLALLGISVAFAGSALTAPEAITVTEKTQSPQLAQEQASGFARLALKCLGREFPNKPEHVLNGSADLQSPRALHPAFFGCFDWHSSVHGHWMLVRLLRRFPQLPEGEQIRAILTE